MTELERILIDTIRAAPDPSAMIQLAQDIILSVDLLRPVPYGQPAPADQQASI